MTRVPWKNRPAITWTVTKDKPRDGLDHIINCLEGRYNPITTDANFSMDKPNICEMYPDARIRLEIDKDGKEYGNVGVVYKGETIDESTWENKTAQKFWVFFNMYGGSKISYQERDYFLKK